MDRLRALQNGGSVGGGGASPAFFGANAGARSGYEAFDSNLGARGDDRWKMEASLQPSLPFTLRAGTTVIPAVLITGINSDLPGQVMAQVGQDVYDTATGKYLLVPQGTRLAGQYGSDVAYGQERVLMAWQRLIFPDGQALDIGSMPGADSAGYSGLADRVNTHFFKAVSSAFLMSGVIAGVSLSQDRGSYSGNSGTQRSSDALSEALGQTMGQTLMQMLQKNLNLSPTLEIRPGYRLNVMVAKDLTFKRPYRKKR